MQVVIVAVQALLVLFHKRHLNMDIAISASTFFFFFLPSPRPCFLRLGRQDNRERRVVNAV